MIDAQISCAECKKFYDPMDLNLKCDECDKNAKDEEWLALGKKLLAVIFEELNFEGKRIVGFNSKERKKEYLKVRNVGITYAAFAVADYFGLETLVEWQRLEQERKDIPVIPSWTEADENS